jgi:hypothetical protein
MISGGIARAAAAGFVHPAVPAATRTLTAANMAFRAFRPQRRIIAFRAWEDPSPRS